MVVYVGDDTISENSPITVFLRDRLRVAQFNFKGDSDWTLIIKFSSYLEATLNFLLTRYFEDARLEKVFSYLDFSDRKRGKMAFINALELLPKEERDFIKQIADLRNDLVHNAKNIDFNLKFHVENMDAQQRKNFKTPIQAILKTYIEDGTEKSNANLCDENLRGALLVCVIAIMMRAYGRDLELSGLPVPSKSNPKAP